MTSEKLKTYCYCLTPIILSCKHTNIQTHTHTELWSSAQQGP